MYFSKSGQQHIQILPPTLHKSTKNPQLIKNNKDSANAMHYNTKGHSVSDFRALIIERVIPNDGAWLLEREDMWIKTLETKNMD